MRPSHLVRASHAKRCVQVVDEAEATRLLGSFNPPGAVARARPPAVVLLRAPLFLSQTVLLPVWCACLDEIARQCDRHPTREGLSGAERADRPGCARQGG